MTLTALLFDNPITRLPSNLYNLFFSSDQSVQLPSKLPNDLIDTCKGVILDMDGVLRIGNEPIINDKVVQKISNSQIPTIIITNECRKSPRQIRKELNKMGLNIQSDWSIISASYLCCQYLRKKLTEDVLDMKNHPYNYSTYKTIKRRKKIRKIYNSPKISIGVIGDLSLYKYLFVKLM